MTVKQKEDVISALCEFAIRAATEGATIEEVQALPKVAEILVEIIPD